jgi:hypothetical protein
MSKTTIRARMKPDLVPLMQRHFGAKHVDADDEAFYRSIEGREVSLSFTLGDAFDATEDNHWLPDNTWDAHPEDEALLADIRNAKATPP